MLKRGCLLTWALLCLLAVFGQNTETLTNQFLELFNNGKYKEALPVALQSVKQSAGEFGANNVNYAICCQNVGTTYSQLAEWGSSTQWMHESIRAYGAATGTTDIVEVHECMKFIATNFLNIGQYDSSRIYFVEAYNYFAQYPDDQYGNLMEVAVNFFELCFATGVYDDILTITETLDSLVAAKNGPGGEQYYRLLISRADAFRQKTHFLQAYEVYLKSEKSCLNLFGENHIEYAELLDLQADCLRNLGRMKECEMLLEKSGAIFRNQKSIEPLALASHHNNNASYFGEVALFSRAFGQYDTAMNILEKAGLEKILLYGAILKGRTYTYMDAAMYPEALVWLQKADNWFNTQFSGQYNPYRAELLVARANIGYFTNRYNAASTQVMEAIGFIKNSPDSASYLLARCYEIRALIEHARGNSREAIDLCRQSITINNRFFGDSNLYTANALSNLGIIFQDLGDYAAAEKVLRESFAIKWRLFEGKPHPQIALSLANWAMVLIMQERYNDADQLLAQSLEILKANNMLGSSNGQAVLNNVALLAQKQGDYSGAEKLYRQVMESLSQTDLDNKQVYVIALANMSTVMLSTGKADSALIYANKTMQLTAEVLGQNSALYLKAGNNALVALGKLNRPEEGRQIAQRLLPLVRSTMGDSSELMGTTLGNFAINEVIAGRLADAARLQQHALDIQLRHFKQNLFALSERDQVAWWTSRSFMFQLQPAILAKLDKPNEALMEKMVNQQLQLKGLILHNAQGALQKIRKINNPKLQQLIDQWQSTKTLYLSESTKPIAERRFNIDSLGYMANVLEQAINTTAGNQFENVKEVTWQDVQAKLGKAEAAVEYIKYPEMEGGRFGDNVRFAAIVISPTGKPRMVDLGSESAIRWCLSGGEGVARDMQVSKLYRTKIGNVGTVLFTGDSLYRLIWKPLEGALLGARVVHLAPEGVLNKVAFSALPIGPDSVLLDKMEIRQYASVRQVGPGDGEKVAIQTAFLAGNAAFRMGAPAGSAVYWSDLPGTGREISAIYQFLLSKGKKVVKVDSTRATEAAVKAIGMPSPDIIHIATHGFFLNQPAPNANTANEPPNDPAFLSGFSDPLLRSGIILAGANKYWEGQGPGNSGDDGILTAFELAQLNWGNTKVVTLSACETGLGEVQDGEGVFGLKRALKLTGARFTLVSLWQVPDAETAELMSMFYGYLLSGFSVRTAFYKAQGEMRHKYKPFAWAAFVLSE